MASPIAPSISQFGRTEPFDLQVSRGQIFGHRSVVVFGYNQDVDQARATVWPYVGIIPFLETPIKYKVSSSSANDTNGGTGAQTVYIEGLNGDHNEVSEIVVMNGQTAVLTANEYTHINDAYVATAGSSFGAEGDIYFGDGAVTGGVPATVYDLIKFDYNRRVTGVYTIPAGYTGYITHGQFSAGQDSGATGVTGRLLVVGEDGIRRAAAVVTVNNSVADYDFRCPIMIREKSAIEASAQGSANNNTASCMFCVMLVKNDGAL